jgi:hypothetical protein
MPSRSFGRSKYEARVKRTTWTNKRQGNDPRRRVAGSADLKKAKATREPFAKNLTSKWLSPVVPAAIHSPSSPATESLNFAKLVAAIVVAFAATSVFALAAGTPAPNASPHALPSARVRLPTIPLHTEMVVEVNKKGQVVRVKSTKWCKVQSFNVQTFGNALQMWIRRPNGGAEAGLYRVTYDFDPKSGNVARHVALIYPSSKWANDQGAADLMIKMAHQQAVQAQKAALEAQKKAEERNSKLPSLNEIRGAHASPSPKPSFLPPV